jgi:hypothetical protein
LYLKGKYSGQLESNANRKILIKSCIFEPKIEIFMDKVLLRFQIVLFGNFDDINPSADNIKYFIENFSEQGLIPSQFNELRLGIPNIQPANNSRLSLTSNDSSWNIMFGKERLDYTLTNINIGVFELPAKENFLKTFKAIYEKLYLKFPKNIKRIGFVCQYLIRDADLNSFSQKNVIRPSFFEKSLIEFSNRYACRTSVKIPNDEIINVIGELTWVRTLMMMNNRYSPYNGLLLNLDINTLIENPDFRLNNTMIDNFLCEASKIEDSLVQEYIKMF